MKGTIMFKKASIVLMLFFWAAFLLAQDSKEREWPSEISMEIRDEMFLKFHETLEGIKNKKEKISLALVDGKLPHGLVQSLEKEQCTLLDYQNKSHRISFEKIKARSIAKFIPSEGQNEKILYALGVLFFYDKEWKAAEIYFQKSAAKGYQEALSWVAKIKEKQDIVLKNTETETEPPKKVETKKEEPKKEEPKAVFAEKIVFIRGGKKLDVNSQLVAGKYTVLQFTADWCGPCKMITPQVEAMVKQSDALYLRKIDIVNWSTPVAKQFNIKSIPYFMIYDPQGKMAKEGGANILQDFMKK